MHIKHCLVVMNIHIREVAMYQDTCIRRRQRDKDEGKRQGVKRASTSDSLEGALHPKRCLGRGTLSLQGKDHERYSKPYIRK